MMTRDDASLRDLYARLQAARRPFARAGEVPVETIHALATGSYDGADREALLDDVLANAATHAEFQFFRDLARERPRARAAGIRTWGRPLALAASAILVVTLGVQTLSSPPREDPFRGGDSTLVVLSALPEGPAWRFTWRPVVGAIAYDLEVLDSSGQVVATAATSDSTLVTAIAPAGATTLSWYVRASLVDGRTVRSAVQTMPLSR